MRIIVCITMCLSCLAGKTQIVFNNIYDYSGHLETVEGILEIDDGYIMLLRTSNAPISDRRLIIHRLGMEGNSIWSKVHFADSTVFFPARSNDVEPTEDGGFIVGGVIRHGEEDDYDACLIKFDSNGNIEWQKEYGGIETDAAISMQKTPDGGYILGGESYSIDSDGDFYLVKTDAQGEMEWDTHLGGIGYQVGYSVDYTPDGGYVISGRGGNPPFAVDIAVAKCDAQGNQLWSKIYGGPFDNDASHDVKALSDGTIIISGGMGNGSDNYSIKSDAYLIKVDQDGEVIWEKIYDEPYSFSHLSNILELEDGSIVVTAIKYPNESDPLLATLNKYDANGEPIWQRVYPNPNPQVDSYLYGLTPASDGGFLAYGSAYDPEWDNFQEGWLIKTDSEGYTCEEVNCVVVDVEELPIAQKEPLEVFPNPSIGMINIHWHGSSNARIGIYTVNGHVVWSGQNRTQLQVDLSGQPPGMYFVKAINGQEQVMKKLVLSH